MAVALLAGKGLYPVLFAQAVKERGERLVVIGFRGQIEACLRNLADSFYELRFGQLGRLLKILKKEKVQEVALAGAIDKPRALWEARPDFKALSLWRKLKTRHDDEVLRAVVKEIEALGLEVISPTRYLPDLLTPKGVLSQRKPSRAQQEDIVFGYAIAKAIGELDVGQCVVVKDRMVVAVEALEGTDATIKRAGELLSETVVVKVMKPNQDFRFDLPSAGPQTIESMLKARAKVLALEAGKTLFFERQRALALADQAGMVVVGI